MNHQQGSVFPFISVMFCTTGALVLLWAAGTLVNTVEDEGIDNRIETLKSEVAELKREISELEKERKLLAQMRGDLKLRLDQLQKEIMEADRQLAEALAELERLRERHRQLQEEAGSLAKLLERLETARKQLQEFNDKLALNNAIKEKRAILAALRNDIAQRKAEIEKAVVIRDELRAEIERLLAWKKKLEEHAGIMARLAVRGGKPDYEPIWIEVDEDGYRLINKKSSTFHTYEDFLKEGGVFSQYRAPIRRRERFPVFVVRSEGAQNYRKVGKRLRDEHIVWSSVPIEGDWVLVIEKDRLRVEEGDGQ